MFNRILSFRFLIVLLIVYRSESRIGQREQPQCSWPDTDTLFIIDSTLNISPYDHVQEIAFVQKLLTRMTISSNHTRVAIAQFTPRSKHELSLAATGGPNGAETALSTVQSLQHIGCDITKDENGCEPTASVNMIAQYSLKEGNRKQIPDVIIVVSSSKWPIPELRDKETLMSPTSPIHAFYILVGSSSVPQRKFEPAATSIMLTAVDFSSLIDLVHPLCRSVNDFVFYGSSNNPGISGHGPGPGGIPGHGTGAHNNSNHWPDQPNTRPPLYPSDGYTNAPIRSIPWDYFSPLAWTITAVLILLFFVIVLALALAIWQYREENNRLRRKIIENERNLRTQNEYFTNKLHKQMEGELAARAKFEEELRKAEEAHHSHAERLEKRLEKHLEAPVPAQLPPPPPPPQPQPIIIPAFFGHGNHGTHALIEYAKATGAHVALPPQKPQPGAPSPHPNNQYPHLNTQMPHPMNQSQYPVNHYMMPQVQSLNNAHGQNHQNQSTIIPMDPSHGSGETSVLNPSAKPSKRSSVVSKVSKAPSKANKPRRSSSLETAELNEHRRHRSSRRRSSWDSNRDDEESREGRGTNGTKKSTKKKKKKKSGIQSEVTERLDSTMIVLPSGRRIKGNINDLMTIRELQDIEEELETSRRLGRMTERLKLKNELDRLDLALSNTENAWKGQKDYLNNRRRSSDDSGIVVERSGTHVHYQGSLPFDHPARILPPIDLLFLVDSSSSIGLVAFEQVKQNIEIILRDVDIAPGRSRVSLIQYARQPTVVFGFDKYYSVEAVKRALNRMPYTGGATYLAKALHFAAGILWHEQNLKNEKLESLENAPVPRHDRLQILMIVSDGASEDNIDRATSQLHEQLQVKVGGMVTRGLNKEKLVNVTRFDGAVFVMDQTESINIWLWRQQRLWMDNYEQYLEREKSLITAREELKKREKPGKKSGKKNVQNMSKLKLNSSMRTARSIRPLSFL